MRSEFLSQILDTIETQVRSRPSAMEFEMAYQARLAIDRMKFAIKQIEQFALHSDQAREASLQLVDALDRLETADRHFQNRFHGGSGLDPRRTRPTGMASADDPAENGRRL
jgi:hypothetical protein